MKWQYLAVGVGALVLGAVAGRFLGRNSGAPQQVALTCDAGVNILAAVACDAGPAPTAFCDAGVVVRWTPPIVVYLDGGCPLVIEAPEVEASGTAVATGGSPSASATVAGSASAASSAVVTPSAGCKCPVASAGPFIGFCGGGTYYGGAATWQPLSAIPAEVYGSLGGGKGGATGQAGVLIRFP